MKNSQKKNKVFSSILEKQDAPILNFDWKKRSLIFLSRNSIKVRKKIEQFVLKKKN